MSYPENTLPVYELIIPSTKKKLAYKPYTVAQEKLLLMAAESDDKDAIHSATKQAVAGCLTDKSVDVGKLTPFDVDYIFAHCRAKSVGETVDLDFTCHNKVGDKECGGTFQATININDVKIVSNDRPATVDLGNGLNVYTQYPTYDSLRLLSEKDTDVEASIKLIAASIKAVAKGENVISASDVKLEETYKFIESLTKGQYEKLKSHVEDIPQFEVKTQATCPTCQHVHELSFNDITSFF
jgi:hypothetical protein